MYRGLNMIVLAVAVVILLGDTMPGMVLRTALLMPLWELEVIDVETLQVLIWEGHL